MSRGSDAAHFRALVVAGQSAATLEERGLLGELEDQRCRVRELEELNQTLRDRCDRLEQVSAIRGKLTQMVLNGSGIDGITRATASLVENPVAVEDKFFRLISYAPHPQSGKRQNASATEFEGTARAALNDPAFCEQVRAVLRKAQPVRLPAHPRYGLHWGRLVAAITVGKTTLGYVSAFEKNRPFCDLDLVAAEHAAIVFALELQKQKTVFEVEQRLRGHFLDDLLTGNYDSGQVMLRRAALLDYDLSSPHVVMIVGIDGLRDSRDGNASSDEPEPASARKKLLELVRTAVSRASPKSIIVGKGSTVIVMLNLLSESLDNYGLVSPKEVAEAIKQEVAKHFQRLTVSIAISDKCKRLDDYKRSYQVARKSLDIAKAFDQRDRIVSFDKLGVYQILLQVHDREGLKEFVRQSIGPLIGHDDKHSSSLIEALESYLQNECNLQRTARATQVPVSTLKYRLQRIQEITNLDLDDSEIRLRLHLALKIWRLIN